MDKISLVGMEFQLGHFLAEMDSLGNVIWRMCNPDKFQLGHFLAEMDRKTPAKSLANSRKSFNWATS